MENRNWRLENGKWKLENRNSDAESLEHDTKNCKLRPEVHLLSQRLPASVLPSLVSIFQFLFSIFQFRISVPGNPAATCFV